jgi:hypothetical protein
MNIYIVNSRVNKAILCGYLYAITDSTQFSEYIGQELRGHLTNIGDFETMAFNGAVAAIGCTNPKRIFNDRDYYIDRGDEYGDTSGDFRFYCEDDLPSAYDIIKPEPM